MDDVISRQVAIDAIETIGHIATMPDGDKCIRRSAVKYTLSMLPSAQSDIILCKDCKHRPTRDEDGWLDFPTERCPCQNEDDYYYSWMPKDDWFCGNAERREE